MFLMRPAQTAPVGLCAWCVWCLEQLHFMQESIRGQAARAFEGDASSVSLSAEARERIKHALANRQS
jgi:hypothetical protein